ncbi:MAG: redoxin family protein [Arcobacteraceae bacterium]|nr:redoxin family protein [Arcobacteraceae bacterium]
MNKIKHYLKEILSFVILIVVLSNIISYYKALDISKDKLDIKNVSLNNKPILIHFWATWCPTCKVEALNIQTLSQSHNVLTIAVNSGNDIKIKKYLDDNNLDFKVINDHNSFYAKKFNISVFPTTLIYDKNKNLVFSEVGYTSTIGLLLRMLWASL